MLSHHGANAPPLAHRTGRTLLFQLHLQPSQPLLRGASVPHAPLSLKQQREGRYSQRHQHQRGPRPDAVSTTHYSSNHLHGTVHCSTPHHHGPVRNLSHRHHTLRATTRGSHNYTGILNTFPSFTLQLFLPEDG